MDTYIEKWQRLDNMDKCHKEECRKGIKRIKQGKGTLMSPEVVHDLTARGDVNISYVHVFLCSAKLHV